MSSLYNEFEKHLVPYTTDLTKNLPQRVSKSLKNVNPNKIFIFNDKPLILYFETNDNLTKSDIVKKYWNFSEAPIIFIEDENSIEIYNGFEYILNDDQFLPKKLDTTEEELNYLSLISGEFLQTKHFDKIDTKLDTSLLENIRYAREEIIKKLDCNNKESIANALLGRVIFIRYLIDREIALYYQDKKQLISNNDLKDILSDKDTTYQFFENLQSYDKGFNGDWFPIEDAENDLVEQKHLNILKNLISGYDFRKRQGSLFDFYDFSIIPIEFISNIYEQFIGEKKQKKDGAYYTPTFLVDYVLKHTVDKYFEDNPKEYNCKVLDPACGSGIFLVETFRKLVAQYEKVTNKKADEKIIKELVTNNIYGIDINKNALDISVFSLYLAMLDYQDTNDIENFKFPYLRRNNPNFFENDFFDIEASFNKVLNKKKLNFIIGNPPYGRGLLKDKALKYINKENISIGGKDIVQAFMMRVEDFCSDTVKVSFIVSSKVLYNLDAKGFRNQFLNQFKINRILELSSVRHQVFENANPPVSILFYEHSTKEDIEDNVINYISMKPSSYFEKLKLLLISKNDIKEVSQTKLLDNDYLWKILVYGSYLDFNFIKRLGIQYDSISDFLVKNEIEPKQGFKLKDGNKKNDTSRLKGIPYINLKNKKTFFPFYIKDNLDIFNYDTVGYIYKRNDEVYKELYYGNSLLVKDSIDRNTLRQISAICYKKAIFTDSITAIQIKSNNLNNLKNINGLIYSILFAYFILQKGSYAGIEREKANDDEKFSFPYLKNEKIILIVSKIEEFQKDFMFDNKYKQEYSKLVQKLDKVVLNAFNLTEQEYALVDYATKIIIPWVIQKDYSVAFSQYKFKDKAIEEYVEIFTKHYSNIYEQNNLYFQAAIYYNTYAIGISFKILDDKPLRSIVWKEEKNIQNFLKLMKVESSEKNIKDLFIQKDIKGFEHDGFYVVKPNEYKNWHKAIGYLDFYEFDDAILRAGK